MTSRIPFDYTLLDARRRPFAEGESDRIAPLGEAIQMPQLSLWAKRWVLRFIAAVAVLYIFGMMLAYEMQTPWAETAATVAGMPPKPEGFRGRYKYAYDFTAQDSRQYQGTFIRGAPDAYAPGSTIQVRYDASDPGNNGVYDPEASEGARVLMEAVILICLAVIAAGAFSLWSVLAEIAPKLSRRAARTGYAIPGKVVGVETFICGFMGECAKIEYTAALPDEPAPVSATAIVPLAYLAGAKLPQPGTAVALWYVPERRAHVLL